MSAFVARQRAESALNFLPQKTEWMEPFHIGNHLVILREYVDHLERDNVLMHVVAGMRRKVPRTGKDWFDEAGRLGAPAPLPQDPVRCFTLRYELMRAVRMEKVDLRYFVSSYYPGAHLNEKLMNWKRAVVHPFAEDMRRFGKLLLARLPEGEGDGQWIDLEPLVDAALDEFGPLSFGTRVWTDQDDENPPRAPEIARTLAPGKAPETLEGALEELSRAVSRLEGVKDEERHDLLLDARILSLEARKKTPAGRSRIESRLGAFAAHASLGPAVEAVRQRLA